MCQQPLMFFLFFSFSLVFLFCISFSIPRYRVKFPASVLPLINGSYKIIFIIYLYNSFICQSSSLLPCHYFSAPEVAKSGKYDNVDLKITNN